VKNIKFSMIVATDSCQGIGKDNKLPWSIPSDMAYFKRVTTTTIDPSRQNAVIMGRKTWESIPEKYRPLPNRYNIVLSREKGYQAEGAVVCDTIDNALLQADKFLVENIFIIGGGAIYEQAVMMPNCVKLYITEIQKDYQCDTFFTKSLDYQRKSTSSTQLYGGVSYTFSTYERIS